MNDDTAKHDATAEQAPHNITIHDPTPELLQDIAGRLSADDVAELKALGFDDPLQALTASVGICREAYVACWNGQPQAAFGVADHREDDMLGVPWMLSTGAFENVRHEFLAAARGFVAAWALMYRALFNIVHARNVRAQRWLIHLGFEPLKAHTVNSADMIEFGRLSDV